MAEDAVETPLKERIALFFLGGRLCLSCKHRVGGRRARRIGPYGWTECGKCRRPATMHFEPLEVSWKWVVQGFRGRLKKTKTS